MVKYVNDQTGRFSQRPHYSPKELDRECEMIINEFLTEKNGQVSFPVSTDDLQCLVERDTNDLDLYADLSVYGATVEGVTEFRPGGKPDVRIAAELSNDERRENRLRTTLTHEYGHVRFHSFLWEMEPPRPDLLAQNPNLAKQICKRDTILDAGSYDWMEWQAGYICGALLMPVTRLRRLVADYQETHRLFGSVAASGPHAAALIGRTKEEFAVSADAARVRLLKLSFISRLDAGPSLFDQ